MAITYPVGPFLKQMATLLDLSVEKVLRRVGLSASLAANEEISVGARTFFGVWDAICEEADRPGVEMELAMAYAHGPFMPPVFAFSCAETLELGLARLAVFKPIVGPISMEITRGDGELSISMRPSDPDVCMSPSFGVFELLYITECARTFSGAPVTPIEATLPGEYQLTSSCLEYLGVRPSTAGFVGLTFASKDADLPLITRSESLWKSLEPGFLEQLAERSGTKTLSGQIKQALTEALPGGSTSIDDMAKRLNLSKRSLQRRLTEEGTNFQELLSETRFEMSRRYLRDSALSVPEISYLLGFRHTSSFFRAFYNWTGTNPGDFRASKK